MAADTNGAQTKITYATMTADRMEDLHRELDRAIEQVQTDLREELSARDWRERSPLVERIRGSQPDRHANPARPVSKRQP